MPTSQKMIFTLFLASIFSTFFLVACSGALIDINIDPTTGTGNIIVNPQATAAPTGGTGSTDMSQVALFAIVVIVLLGVMAIVFSVARRPGREE